MILPVEYVIMGDFNGDFEKAWRRSRNTQNKRKERKMHFFPGEDNRQYPAFSKPRAAIHLILVLTLSLETASNTKKSPRNEWQRWHTWGGASSHGPWGNDKITVWYLT